MWIKYFEADIMLSATYSEINKNIRGMDRGMKRKLDM